MIAATRPKECTDCRQPVKVKEVIQEGKEVVVVTECKACKIEYTSTFAR